MTIRNATISNTVSGIVVDNNSDIFIDGCTLTRYEGEIASNGIWLTNSSPTILSTSVTGFGIGIYGITHSKPVLQNGELGGYNTINSNGNGVCFDYFSDAILGVLGFPPTEGGQNSFIDNSPFNVVLKEKCEVYALLNYWGSREPDPGLFNISENSNLYYVPFLSEPPGGGRPFVINTSEASEGESSGPSAKVLLAIQKRLQRQYAEALIVLKSIITDAGEPPEARQWAVAELLAVSQMMRNNPLSGYLIGLLSSHPQFRQLLSGLLPSAYMYERSITKALATYDQNISNFPNSMIEAQALHGKFTHALYGLNDREAAEAIYHILEARYPESGQRCLAQMQLQATPVSRPEGRASPSAGLTSKSSLNNPGRPGSYALWQNYPNPFNPATTIKYDLPIDAHVSLKLYDVLGKEVLTLVDGFISAGFHEVSLDASNLSSGVYFYKITVGSFTDVKKLLLLR
jgi:hypothetical protein